MANARDWPAGIICISFGPGDAYVVRRPTTYQNLIATASSLFRASFDGATEELYVKTNDFGLEWPVEVLPEVWEMPDVQGFFRTVEFHTRTRGEGPSQLNFTDGDRTQASIPLSPSSTPPRDVPERAIAHSTPANRRAEASRAADDGPASVSYRGDSEDEEVEQHEHASSRNVRSRVSLQARGPNGNPRPIRTIRAEPTNEEVMPPSSQESDAVADAKIEVNVSYGDNEVTVRVRSGKTFASLFNGACDHFEVDKDTLKLFQLVEFDGRESISPIECNLTMTLSECNVANGDYFRLIPYDGQD